MSPVVGVIVVDNYSTAHIAPVIFRSSPVVVVIGVIKVLRSNEYPPAFRTIEAKTYAGTQRSPTAVLVA